LVEEQPRDQSKQGGQFNPQGTTEPTLPVLGAKDESSGEQIKHQTSADESTAKEILVRIVGEDSLKPFEIESLRISGAALVESRKTTKVAVGAFLAAVVAAFFVWVQWREMNNQTIIAAAAFQKAMADSIASDASVKEQLRIAGEHSNAASALASAARAQSDQAIAANRLNQEAMRGRIEFNKWVVEPGPVEGSIRLVATWKNIGHSVASMNTGSDTQRWRKMPEGEMHVTMSTGPTPDAFVVEPGSTGTIEMSDLKPVTQAFLDGLPYVDSRRRPNGPNSPETLYFFGRLAYKTMGRQYSKDFCSYLFQMRPEHLTGHPNLSRYMPAACPKWNTPDQPYKEHKRPN